MVSDLFIKIGLIFSSWFFAQVQPFAEMGISKGFDQLFTIGMMMLFIIYIINESKKKDKKVNEGQDIYVELLKSNTRAFNDFAKTSAAINDHLRETDRIRRERYDKLHIDIKELNDKLDQVNK